MVIKEVKHYEDNGQKKKKNAVIALLYRNEISNI